MKVQVNGTTYDIDIVSQKIRVNDTELAARINEEEEITLGQDTYYLDFVQEGDEGQPSLMIINGMTYLVSKSSFGYKQLKDVKAPISGKVKDVFVELGSKVKEGQIIVIIEAMKMEIQIKSPSAGTIKEIKACKDQPIKTGDIVVSFE
ncbi:MAG: biotin/lipoyl-binding protein [Nitrososphaeraceae archaeon]|nr:biotin/lipoyl-binding protein [Nitrososphaeraceae archaeon]MBV9668969.1 biotin/lipoyl-binding protein [Nitrososphaeraceae archaeon]